VTVDPAAPAGHPAPAGRAAPASPAAPSARARSLRGRRVAVDARYLRRHVGISAYLRGSLHDLTAAGAALTLLTDARDHVGDLRAEYPAASVALLPGRSGFLWEQRTLRRHLRAHDYDAFIAPANYGIPFGYRGRTTMILVVHDLIPLRLPRLYLLTKPAWAAKYLLSMAAAAIGADRIVAVSDATARDVARLLRREATDVVYPCLPEPYSPPEPDHAPDPFASPAQHPYFVYNGGADPRKNVAVLLRAFAALQHEVPEVELVLLGSDMGWLRPLIQELGIGSRVRLPGFVDEAAKMRLIHDALALVYPSTIEGFGLPVVEALAAGTPVICGTGGALPEVGGDAVSYVRPVTPAVLAAALRSAVTAAGARSEADARDEPRARNEASARSEASARGLRQLSVLRERRDAHTLADAVAEALPAADAP
jgi:glycosyltransferase involved in cell wall biosynthesis